MTKILLTKSASNALADLERTAPAKLRKARKALGLLRTNPRHPSLHTHEFHALKGPNGEKVFEAYVENKTPAAF